MSILDNGGGIQKNLTRVYIMAAIHCQNWCFLMEHAPLEGRPGSKLTRKERLWGQWECTMVLGEGGMLLLGCGRRCLSGAGGGGVSNFCPPMMTMTRRMLPVSHPWWSQLATELEKVG